MPTSSNKTPSYFYWIVGIWLVWVVIGFIYLVSQRLVEFDPNQQLLTATPQEIVAQFANQTGSGQRIYHLIDQECHCTSLLTDHRQQINKIAKKDGFEIIDVDINRNEIATLVPATPAIVIVDNNDELLYVGPYATGLDCSADNSLIDVVLDNYRQGFSAPTIINDAKGCYCAR